jgi:hypothetical protein
MECSQQSWVRELRNLAEASSPGPWFIGEADDTCSMTANYVATVRQPPDGWPSGDKVVAITFLQTPGIAMTSESDENAMFIAAARMGVPRLCESHERIVRERDQLAAALRVIVESAEMPATGLRTVRIPTAMLEDARRLISELDAETSA